MSNERKLAEDPIVAAAIAAHGGDDEFAWTYRDGGEQLSLQAGSGRPRVSIRDGCAMVRWWGPGGAVHYEVTSGGAPPTLTLNDADLAHSLVATLAGRPLRDLVELDGDPGLTILDAGTQRLGEFPSLWARLGKTPDQPKEPAWN